MFKKKSVTCRDLLVVTQQVDFFLVSTVNKIAALNFDEMFWK